jgi:nucleoside-diphosphate-sugar epimerase
MSKSIGFIILHAQLRRFTINTIRCNDEDKRARCDQHAGTCETPAGKNSPGFHVRSLWRSERPPSAEDYWGHVNPIGPRSCYDEGKRCAETLFFDYWRQHRLQIKVARLLRLSTLA